MDAYEELLGRLRDIDMVGQIGGLLGWDQEVLMPPKAAALRAEQLAWISKTGHERLTDPRIGELLSELEGRDGMDDVKAANVRLARESYDKATKLPTDFVEEMAKHRSKSLVSWTEARGIMRTPRWQSALRPMPVLMRSRKLWQSMAVWG